MLISNYNNIINNNKGVSKYMLNKILKSKKAFTIVEVVLVLAIAGVIMAVVFLAVPALQAGQRDQSRKTDANNVLLALTTYQGNNSGNNPDNNAAYSPTNVTLSGASAATTVILTSYVANTLVSNTPGQITVVKGAKCAKNSAASYDNRTHTPGASKQVAVIVALDNAAGTTGDYWCVQS